MWTAALTATGVVGLWLVARHWYGWLVYLLNEMIWLAYGLSIGSQPVIVMSVIWGILGVRNLYVARKSYLSGVRSHLPEGDHAGGSAVQDLPGLLRRYVHDGCGLVPHSHNGIGQCGTDPLTW
jgi:hypothetical protein